MNITTISCNSSLFHKQMLLFLERKTISKCVWNGCAFSLATVLAISINCNCKTHPTVDSSDGT